jgi:hypothetical protein
MLGNRMERRQHSAVAMKLKSIREKFNQLIAAICCWTKPYQHFSSVRVDLLHVLDLMVSLTNV